jgi:hypothetical protein
MEEKLANVEEIHVIRQKPGSQEARRTGAEQTGRPSEAEYSLKCRIARKKKWLYKAK